MKKTATLLGAFALSLLSFQSFSQVKLGLKAGANISTFGYDFKDSEEETLSNDITKNKIGYHVGLAAEFGFTDNLSLQSGLIWTNKGAKYDYSLSEDGVEMEIKGKTSLNYLEIPLNLTYKISNFQIQAGPYVAYGIGGKEELESKFTFMGETDTDKDDADVKFKNTVEESDFDEENTTFYRALDLGLNFGIGYMAGPVLLNANYSLGMSNLTPDFDGDDDDSADDSKIKNRVIGISATYFFGGK
ncbi:porin family protein [Adhaeribacter soli]|uniref:PorT family protein n=1 Tax=Adhaeribacter soli TaxID=2607655 RepID=A0A5N1J788_9BACT|nr:porin family protein [Adhaeribacter soli]KAA9340670.1 PorT family protein [Adhaeribacter soli]